VQLFDGCPRAHLLTYSQVRWSTRGCGVECPCILCGTPYTLMTSTILGWGDYEYGYDREFGGEGCSKVEERLPYPTTDMLHLIFAAALTIDGSPVSRKERNLQSASRSDQWIKPRGIGVQTIPVRGYIRGSLLPDRNLPWRRIAACSLCEKGKRCPWVDRWEPRRNLNLPSPSKCGPHHACQLCQIIVTFHLIPWTSRPGCHGTPVTLQGMGKTRTLSINHFPSHCIRNRKKRRTMS
jgi:hypothetical protein